MPLSDQYRSRIWKTYSIMVEYKGTPHRVNVPASKKNETFKQWKDRVLGPGVTDVTVLGSWQPAPQTKMHSIQKWSNLRWPKLIAKEVATKKDLERQRAVSKETALVRKSYIEFPALTLSYLATSMDSELHPAAKEFLKRTLKENGDRLDTEKLVRTLLRAYNDALCEMRRQARSVE